MKNLARDILEEFAQFPTVFEIEEGMRVAASPEEQNERAKKWNQANKTWKRFRESRPENKAKKAAYMREHRKTHAEDKAKNTKRTREWRARRTARASPVPDANP